MFAARVRITPPAVGSNRSLVELSTQIAETGNHLDLGGV